MRAHAAEVWISYNGEIYELDRLRRILADRNLELRTRSDTEVVLALYLVFGDEFYKYLNGEFSFAIIDARSNTPSLLLGRDLFGARPLSYALTDRGIAFASEATALRDILLDPRLDSEAFDQTLLTWAAAPERSAFRCVHSIKPGQVLRWTREGCKEFSHLRDCLSAPARAVPDTSEIRAILDLSIRERLDADSSVGVYLSGGLDSGIIAARASKHLDIPLKSYSISFEEAELDEGEAQRALAHELELDHHQLRLSAQDLRSHFAAATRAGGAFTFRGAHVPLFLLSQLVRETGPKVVLSGEGADELFGGYDLFRELKIVLSMEARDLTTLNIWARDLYRFESDLTPARRRFLLSTLIHASGIESPVPLSHRRRWEGQTQLNSYLSKPLEAGSVLPELGFEDLRGAGFTARLLEVLTLLHGQLLSVQGDRMAMANGIETRLPFLDKRLAEKMLAVDPLDLIQESQEALLEKRSLTEAFAGLIPESLLRQRKTPFRAPGVKTFLPTLRELISDQQTQLRRDLPQVRFDVVEERLLRPDHRHTTAEEVLLFALASAAVIC